MMYYSFDVGDVASFQELHWQLMTVDFPAMMDSEQALVADFVYSSLQIPKVFPRFAAVTAGPPRIGLTLELMGIKMV